MDFLHYIFAFDENSPLLFTQFYFWAFFAIVYALFALIIGNSRTGKEKGRLHLRNVYLLFVSWFFYYKTSGLFLLLLAFVTLSDWLIAQRIKNSQIKNYELRIKNYKLPVAYLFLALSVVIDLGLLAYFKYAYFFTNMINDLFGTGFQVFDIFAYIGNGFSEAGRFSVDTIILPVGISFYIFQVISYTVDVYRQKIEPVKNILDFGFYVSFFPQLVAGPIVRVIMSDYLAVNLIDRVFDNPLLFSGFENLFALFAYSLQVYADFSGYTDIAIGVAMLMGFYLEKMAYVLRTMAEDLSVYTLRRQPEDRFWYVFLVKSDCFCLRGFDRMVVADPRALCRIHGMRSDIQPLGTILKSEAALRKSELVHHAGLGRSLARSKLEFHHLGRYKRLRNDH